MTKLHRFKSAFALCLLSGTLAFAQEKPATEKPAAAKKENCVGCSSFVSAPPNICPLYPTSYSQNGFIYYAEYYDPDCDHIYEAYLDGLFSCPENCQDPENHCLPAPGALNGVPPTRTYPGEAPPAIFNTPHEFAGHTKFYDANYDPLEDIPVKIWRLHAQRIPVQLPSDKPVVRFPLIVKFTVKEVPHFVTINKVMLSKPTDFGTNQYDKSIYYGHEVAPQGKYVELTDGVQAIDAYGRNGKPDVTYFAYRLNLAGILGTESGRDIQAVVFLKR